MQTRRVGRTRMAVVVLVVGFGVATGAYLELRPTKPGVRLMTGIVTRGDVISDVTATGTTAAVETVSIGTQVDGIILELHADFNSVVHKGDIVARLDPALFQTQVAEARAEVARLQSQVDEAQVAYDESVKDLSRAQNLAVQQVITPSDLEDARVTEQGAEASLRAAGAQVHQAQAALDQAEVQVAQTVIRAPDDGIILARNVDVGQTLAARMSTPTLFVLASNLGRLRVEANVDESDIGRIQEGDRASLAFDAYKSETFAGVVSQVRVQPVIDQGVVSYIAVIDVANPDLRLRPGMTAIVTIDYAEHDGVLRVPQSAIHFVPTAMMFASLHQPVPPSSVLSAPAARPAVAPASGRIWVLESGRLRPVAVKIGLADGPYAEIRSSELRPGMTVVTGAAVVTPR